MYTTEKNRIIVDAAELDVKATIECGQFFRYEKTDEGYTVKSGGNSCFVTSDADKVYIDTEAVDFFVNFFNLDRDINRMKRELSRFPELAPALECCGALRILHQPLFETIISFIISANNNIPRIKAIIGRICAAFGDVFPEPAQLADIGLRQLNAIGCGYRSQYILDTSRICAETDILGRMYAAHTRDAQQMLLSLPGVGPKIADCVTLFSLGRFEVFPIDTWMFKTQRVGSEKEAQVRIRLMNKYGEYSGYAQQLLFYYNAILRR